MSNERKSRPAGNEAASTPADISKDTALNSGPPAFDALAALRRRHAAAVRMPDENLDPLYPGRRFHRASTGLRASGYREGYVAALRYLLREFGFQLTDLTRAKLAAIVDRSSR